MSQIKPGDHVAFAVQVFDREIKDIVFEVHYGTVDSANPTYDYVSVHSYDIVEIKDGKRHTYVSPDCVCLASESRQVKSLAKTGYTHVARVPKWSVWA